MIKPIEMWFEAKRKGEVEIRRLTLEGIEGAWGPRTTLWWEIYDAPELTMPPVVDSWVCGHLLWAMRLGQDLVVHGDMSPGGLYNLGELAALRHAISPNLYRRAIEVRPDHVRGVERPDHAKRTAVAGISGGVDSTFSLVRHHRLLPEAERIPLGALVMIQGHDVGLDVPERFELMRRRAEPLAASLGLPIHVMRTDCMRTAGQAWPQAAMPMNGTAYGFFANLHGIGMVGGGAACGVPRFPFTHPAALDMLISNDWFELITDGEGFGRADKIAALRDEPEALADIKVCWAGGDPSRNCGRCEKCVLTRLNFLAAGMPDPPCFDDPLTLDHLAQLPIHTLESSQDLFRSGLQELEARGVTGPVVDLLRKRLSRVPPAIVQKPADTARHLLHAWRRLFKP